jgi:hypothetical protein
VSAATQQAGFARDEGFSFLSLDPASSSESVNGLRPWNVDGDAIGRVLRRKPGDHCFMRQEETYMSLTVLRDASRHFSHFSSQCSATPAAIETPRLGKLPANVSTQRPAMQKLFLLFELAMVLLAGCARAQVAPGMPNFVHDDCHEADSLIC